MLRSGRIALVAVTTLILVVGASVLITASSNQPAGAACNGGTPALVNSYNAAGTLVAQESVTYPGTTCDGDRSYSGAVLDAATDGSCATTYYLEPLAYYAALGTSCTTGGWSAYSYNDTVGPNSVFVSVRPSYLADNWVLSSGY
jgi:hypothetical protein